MDGTTRLQALGAAAQDDGVRGFEAQRTGIGGDVRPALIDDADDAERHPDALNTQTVRPLPRRDHRADRIGQRRDGFETSSHPLDSAASSMRRSSIAADRLRARACSRSARFASRIVEHCSRIARRRRQRSIFGRGAGAGQCTSCGHGSAPQ